MSVEFSANYKFHKLLRIHFLQFFLNIRKRGDLFLRFFQIQTAGVIEVKLCKCITLLVSLCFWYHFQGQYFFYTFTILLDIQFIIYQGSFEHLSLKCQLKTFLSYLVIYFVKPIIPVIFFRFSQKTRAIS